MTATMLDEAAVEKGDLPGHPFRGNQWTGGSNGGSERLQSASAIANLIGVSDFLSWDDITAPGIWFRAQPKGKNLDHRSETSEGELDEGVHVFSALSQVVTQEGLWQMGGQDYDVVVIRGPENLRDTGDVEGYVLPIGRGEIIGRAKLDELVDEYKNQKSPTRLAIFHKALQITTQAVRLKQLLLKDQLRNAVVKAVHVKQYEETERELTEAVAGLIKRQFADAGRKLVRTKGEPDLIEKGDSQGHPFRGNQWTGGTGGMLSPDLDMGSGIAQDKPARVPLKRREGLKYREPKPTDNLGREYISNARLDGMSEGCKKIVLEELDRLVEKYGPIPGKLKLESIRGGHAVGSCSKGKLNPVSPEEADKLWAAGENILNMKIGPSTSTVGQYYHDDQTGSTISFKVDGPRGGSTGWFGDKPEQFGKKYSFGGTAGFITGRGDVQDTIVHEFGHAMANRAGLKNLSRMPANTEVAKIIRSNYAHENLAETVAEAFKYYDAGGRDPVVVKFLDDNIFSRIKYHAGRTKDGDVCSSREGMGTAGRGDGSGWGGYHGDAEIAGTKSPSAKDVFDPRDWDDDLIDTCLPILMRKAGEAAAAQMLIVGVDVAPRKKVGRTEKGDLPGHPFRGNQWGGGGQMFGTPGKHTMGDAEKLVAILEEQTGMKFVIHGSVGRGNTSDNDVDISVVDPSEEELQKLSDETNRLEASVWDRVGRGEITQDQAMEELIGDPNAPDAIEKTMSDLGFEYSKTMKWAGIHVDRYERPSTRHAVEIWRAGNDDSWGVSGKSKQGGALVLMVVGRKQKSPSRIDIKRRDGIHRGPISTPNYHRLWQQIREGKRRCQNCGAGADTVLLVHHVDNDGSNDDADNLRVLCDACHRAMPDGPHTHPAEGKGDLPGHPFRGNQWEGGAGAGQSILDKPIVQSKQGYGSGVSPTFPMSEDFGEGTFGGRSRLGPDAALEYGSIETVSLGDVHATQDVVNPSIVEQFAKGEKTSDKLPRLIRYDGKLHVDDGHHRLEADRLNGKTTSWAIVVNVDKHGLPLKWIAENPEQAREAIQLHEMRQNGKKSPSFLSTKTTATDWLTENADVAGDLLWPEVFTLPSGAVVDMGFATEWPAWMKTEISQQMRETFEQPFWAGINDTTAAGIRSHVERGLLDGLSILEIQQQMVGDGLNEHYHNRGQNIARTESGSALNGARSAAMDRLAEEVPGLRVKRTWMSVLGTTTRSTHASLDGVPADRDGGWYLGGVHVPWPAHWNLPAGERCNCQCTIVQQWGQSDETASELIEEYNERLAAERSLRRLWEKTEKGDLPGHPFRGNQWSGRAGGSGSSGLVGTAVKFDPSAENQEIRMVKQRIPNAVPIESTMTDAEFEKYKGMYEFYRNQRTSDWDRMQAIEGREVVEPVIFGGDSSDRWVTDGVHRLAVAASRGQREFLAYYDNPAMYKSVKGDLPGHPFRGNQWSGGRAGAESSGSTDYGVDAALDVLEGRQPDNAATSVRRIDQTSVKSDRVLKSEGANVARVVEIEDADGVTRKYCFKPDDGENPGVHPAFLGHQSSNEVAGSVIDEAMGLGMVAKTQMAEIGGKKGSLQEWINDDATRAIDVVDWNADGTVKSRERLDKAEGIEDMMYFDALTGNTDRHLGNYLVKDNKIRLIDNGMSMADNAEYGDQALRYRTMEHAGPARAMKRMTPKFKAALTKLIANKNAVDAKLRESGVGATQRQSFWKRASYIQRAGMLGFGDSTMRDLGRLSEGGQLFASFSEVELKEVDGRPVLEIDLKGDLPGHPFRGNQWGQGGLDVMVLDRGGLDEAKKYLGISEMSDEQLGSLCGVVGNPKIKIGVGTDKKRIYIDAESDQYKIAISLRRWNNKDDGDLILEDHSIKSLDKGKGIGTQVIVNQVNAAVSAGVSKITLHAVGSKDSRANGYYTWPRLGFDGELFKADMPDWKLSEAEKLFPEAERLSDLMKSPQGRTWWKENGGDVPCSFDLGKDSLGRRVLNEYVAERAARQGGNPS